MYYGNSLELNNFLKNAASRFLLLTQLTVQVVILITHAAYSIGCSGLKIEMSSYASKEKAAKSFAGKTYFLCTYTDAFHLHILLL